MLNRLVKTIDLSGHIAKSHDSLSFQDILEIPNIVLLGEPGAGKTHLFNFASQNENGKYVTVRNFVIYASTDFTNKPLYIDALDEKRSRGEQQDSIDQLITKIIEFKPSKLRVSCRAADWLGKTDLELFKTYFEANGGYIVVALEALTEEEIEQILRENQIQEPDKFREQAQNKGISSLLSNPQTLLMLADLVKSGEWPKTKKDLYERATSLLLTETNDAHQHKALAGFTTAQLKEAAGAACAVVLIADATGISLLKSGKLPYSEIPYSVTDSVLAALTRRVFTIEGQEANCIHRTIAEYLAACWLVNEIRNGFPLQKTHD